MKLNWIIPLFAAAGLALAGCGGGGSSSRATAPPPAPVPHVCEAGASQACVDARQAELAALGSDASKADHDAAEAALAAARMALATKNAAEARQALVAAAACTDATAECVAAHQALVDALEADDTTTVTALAAARANLATVQMAKADADAAADAAAARQALVDAAACTAATAECVDAHQALVDALEADDTTSEEDLAAARTALATVRTAKNVADAAADAAAARQALVDAAACTAGTAECVEAHQALVAALMADDTTLASDLAAAQANLAAAQMAKRVQDAADARQMIVEAAMCEDVTAECVAHHDALIAVLEKELSDLQASDDATNAEEAAAMKAVADAKATRDAVQMQVAEIDRSTETGSAVGDAVDAANGLADMRSPEDIAAAEELLATAKGMLTEADDYAAQIEAAEMAIARAKARNAVDIAVMDAQTASAALTDDQTKAAVEAARMAIEAAKKAVTDNADALLDADESGFNRQIELAEAPIGPLESQIAAMEAAEQKRLDDMMAVTASKLYAGIGAAPLTGHTVTVDATTGVWSVDPNDVAPANLANQALEADEDTMVAANHGWAGMRHTASGDSVTGTYEALVYSHPDDPTVTEGAAFNAGTANGGYDLSTDAATMGELTTLDAASGGAGVGRVASPSFDQTAGTKEFELGTNMVRVVLSGSSYHGVSGTYYCTPTNATTNCSATVADEGFSLGGGTWTFKPTNPEAKLMDTSADDTDYASYGWWLHKAANDGAFTASAFAIYRGTAPTVDIAALRGTAKYTGGAAGKYSLRGDTGGTNDAGHFTADVTLEATFAAVHSISGMVSNFMGADGMARDWSVALSKSVVAANGAISGALAADGTADTTNTGPQMTTWTIGETASDAAGQWSGNLHEEGDDGVPAIAIGTFSSTYGDSGNDGRMVGAFGANAQ